MGTREEIEQRTSDSLLGYIEDRYHIIGLVGIVVAMFAMRIQTYSNFIRDGEVFFSGNDAWYHFREVVYITEHWPTPIPFDPWTGFPTGQWVGQFGTLYDQLIATIALIIGLGSPSEALREAWGTARCDCVITPSRHIPAAHARRGSRS